MGWRKWGQDIGSRWGEGGASRVGGARAQAALPDGQGFLDVQLAYSKALLQSHTFRIQLLGEQMNSLQWVPTALGVHKCAARWDFDWERRERERDGPEDTGWRSGSYAMAARKKVEE